jgi:hypothetical protein
MTRLSDSVRASTSQDRAFAALLDCISAQIRACAAINVNEILAEHPQFAERLEQVLPALQVLAEASKLNCDQIVVPLSDEDICAGTLGDFRLIREVGRGGMGIVYEAEQISLCRKVALKVLPFAATMDPRQLQRFRNEAQAAACLHHPNIVPVHGVGVDRGVHYYAMQLIEGQTLAEVIAEIREEKSLNHRDTETTEQREKIVPKSSLCSLCLGGKKSSFFRSVAELIASAADALEYAHSMGVLHRDIKPGNLMLDTVSPLPASGRGAGGEGGHIWITDFGLAKVVASLRDAEPGCGETRLLPDLTLTGDMIGTLRYMSPEAALAKHGLVDHRTDIYALGATLYELLTLRPAIDGADKGEMLKRIAWDDPTPLRKHDKSIPAELETITLKCLAKEPSERYANARQLSSASARMPRYCRHALATIPSDSQSSTFSIGSFGRARTVGPKMLVPTLIISVAT